MSLLSEWIAPEYLDEQHVSDLHWTFLDGRPFPHLSLIDFLREDKAEQLSAALQSEPFFEKDADLFQFKQTNDLSTTENTLLKQFYEFLASKDFSDFIRRLTGVSVKSGGVDVFGSLYESTDYLLCHDDHVSDRKIAYLFYLGDDFKMKDGGSFSLLDSQQGKPHEIVKKIPPLFNGFLLFKVSNTSFHSVDEVLHDEKKRYAIGGWLR